MATIFTRIINGEIPCYKIAENDKFFAFLDINPLMKGHTLVIPKKETDYIFDIEDSELAEMMVFAKQIAVKIKEAIPCTKVGVAVIGLEVPHAHIHLVQGIASLILTAICLAKTIISARSLSSISKM